MKTEGTLFGRVIRTVAAALSTQPSLTTSDTTYVPGLSTELKNDLAACG